MAEDGGVNWGVILVPVVIGGIISLAMMAMGRLSKSMDSSLTGSVRLEEIIKRLNFAEETIRSICVRLEEIKSDVKLHNYRLDKLNHIKE